MSLPAIVAGAKIAEELYEKWQDFASSGHGRHTLSLGTPGDSDVVLYEEHIRKGYELFSKVSHTFSYSCSSGERIKAVLCYDKWSDDTGGNPEVISGGVGQSSVRIKVTSQTNRGFHFQFVVYGTRN